VDQIIFAVELQDAAQFLAGIPVLVLTAEQVTLNPPSATVLAWRI